MMPTRWTEEWVRTGSVPWWWWCGETRPPRLPQPRRGERRRTWAAVVAGAIALGALGGAEAQELVLRVPLARAVFEWQHPAPADVEEWIFECGGAPVRVPKAEVTPPDLRVPVSRVITAPGTYTCQLRAANAFGASDPSNAVTFEAGLPPEPGSGLRVVIP